MLGGGFVAVLSRCGDGLWLDGRTGRGGWLWLWYMGYAVMGRQYGSGLRSQITRSYTSESRDIHIIHIDEADVRPVGGQTGIAIEKVLEVKHRRKAHGTGGQVADQLGVTGVDGLQHLALMLDAGPVGPQPGQLVHLAGEELGTGRKDLALATFVVHAVHVDRSRRADAVPHKGGPLDKGRIAGQLNKLGDGIGMRETQVSGLDLPGLVLAGAAQLDQIDRQERPVDQTVDEMINQLAQQQDGALGMAKQRFHRRKNVLGARGPDVQFLTDFRQVGQRVPGKVRVALDAAGRQVAVGDAQDARDVDEEGRSPGFAARVARVLDVGAHGVEELPLDVEANSMRRPSGEPQDDGVVGDEAGAFRAAGQEPVHDVDGPEEPAAHLAFRRG